MYVLYFMDKKYKCEPCNYTTNIDYCYNRHNNTKAHMNKLGIVNNSNTNIFECKYCTKKYKGKNNKIKHYEVCKFKDIIIKCDEESKKWKQELKKSKQEIKDLRQKKDDLEMEFFNMMKKVALNNQLPMGNSNNTNNNTNSNNDNSNNVNITIIINHYPSMTSPFTIPKLSHDDIKPALDNNIDNKN